jgi:hypothetical protein
MVLLGHARGASIPLHLVLKIHFLCLLRRPRGGTVLARAAVRLLYTQKPVPKEDDSWARAGGWSATFGRGEEVHYRRRWRAPHAAVRLPRTRKPTPEEYDPWARAPMPEAGPLLSAETKRRRDSLLAWRFAFSALGDQRTSCMTCEARTPCHWLGTPVCIGGDFPWRFGA